MSSSETSEPHHLVLSESSKTYNETTPKSKIITLTGDNITYSVKSHPGGLIIVKGRNNVVTVTNPKKCTVSALNNCTIRFEAKAYPLRLDERSIPTMNNFIGSPEGAEQENESFEDTHDDEEYFVQTLDEADVSYENWVGKLKFEEDKCCVCLEDIYCEPESKPFWTLSCGHQYHVRCLRSCFEQDEYRKEEKKCFMCRRLISIYDIDAINYHS